MAYTSFLNSFVHKGQCGALDKLIGYSELAIEVNVVLMIVYL